MIPKGKASRVLQITLLFLTTAVVLARSRGSGKISTVNQAMQAIAASPEMKYYKWMNNEGFGHALVNAIVNNPALNAYISAHWNDEFRYVRKLPDYLTKYNCPINRTSTSPRSVHRLTPADIDIVGAIGDSLTAGTGIDASNFASVFNQYRGRTMTSGGDGTYKTVPTVANILKLYNPKLRGFSTGTSNYNAPGSHYNVARPGDTAKAILTQAQTIVERMRRDLSARDYAKKWKLFTILIGHNDLCAYCNDPKDWSVESYKKRISDVLDYMKANIPRAFINLMVPLRVYQTVDLNVGVVCNLLHHYQCECAAFPKGRKAAKAIRRVTTQYQRAIDELVASGRWYSDDFTVVVQPFLKNSKLPRDRKTGKVDLSIFAPDCFHFGNYGEGIATVSLWNNMFEEVGKKSESWLFHEPFACPPKRKPFLATHVNKNW